MYHRTPEPNLNHVKNLDARDWTRNRICNAGGPPDGRAKPAEDRPELVAPASCRLSRGRPALAAASKARQEWAASMPLVPGRGAMWEKLRVTKRRAGCPPDSRRDAGATRVWLQ